MWPALMFAASRKESVMGRTAILVVSISTRNGFSHKGAPSGKKCATNALGLFTILDIIKDSHKGSPSTKVKIKWVDTLKV